MPHSSFNFSNSCGHIGDIHALAKVLDIPRGTIEQEATPYPGRYCSKNIKKKNGAPRLLNVPNDRLKNIQRRINTRIFSTIRWPGYVFGGISSEVRDTDYVATAKYHGNAAIKAELDIADFFPSVGSDHVKNIYRKFFRFSEDLSDLLVGLSTELDELPQGAPTSVALSNLVFFDSEPVAAENLASKGIKYSRFIDDIVITHCDVDHPIDIGRKRLERMIDRAGLSVNPDKTIQRQKKYSGLKVFGFIVSQKKTNVTKQEVRLVKKRIHALQKNASIPNFRKQSDFHHSWHSISGQLNKLQRFSHPKYLAYRGDLRAILPLLPDTEVKNLTNKVRFIEQTISTICKDKAMRKYYNKLRNRIGVLSRSHPRTARSLLDRLNDVSDQIPG